MSIPDSKVHGAKKGATWVLSAPDGPHVGPINLAIRVLFVKWLFVDSIDPRHSLCRSTHSTCASSWYIAARLIIPRKRLRLSSALKCDICLAITKRKPWVVSSWWREFNKPTYGVFWFDTFKYVFNYTSYMSVHISVYLHKFLRPNNITHYSFTRFSHKNNDLF